MAFTTKQRMFVEFYLGVSRGNATDAARRAGYAAPNTAGPRLLVNAGIRALVEKAVSKAAMSRERILERLSEIAEGGTGQFIKAKGPGSFRFDLAAAERAGKFGLLKKVKETPHGVEIECHDPLRALELLGKYHKLWDGDQAKGDVVVQIIRADPDDAPAPRGTEAAEG